MNIQFQDSFLNVINNISQNIIYIDPFTGERSGKEIIIDESVTDEKLGNIIRMMYKAKVETQNEQIKHAKQKTGL
jgi:hypothetical protein